MTVDLLIFHVLLRTIIWVRLLLYFIMRNIITSSHDEVVKPFILYTPGYDHDFHNLGTNNDDARPTNVLAIKTIVGL